MDLEVVDMHTHVLRSIDHGREIYSYFLGRGPANKNPVEPSAYHTVDEAERYMAETGIAHVNILMFTWSGKYWRDGQHTLPDSGPDRTAAEDELRRRIVRRTIDNNEWAVGVAASRPRFSAFVGVNPALMSGDEMVAEVDDKVRKGAWGVKMVPFDTRVTPNDRRLFPLYDYLQGAGVPILSEASGRPGAPGRPAYWHDVFASFPQLKLAFSHLGHDPVFGHGADAEVAELAQAHEGVFTDLSLRLPEMLEGACTPAQFVEHCRRIGTDRVMYGTNYGFVDLMYSEPNRSADAGPQINAAVRNLETFLSLPFTDDERTAIAAGNWHRLVGN